VRLVRPLLERLHAANLVPGEESLDAFERLYADVDAVRAILLDDSRTSARLVVNPARVVVDETRRSFAYLSLYGVATDAVLVNRVLPGAAGLVSRKWAARERGSSRRSRPPSRCRCSTRRSARELARRGGAAAARARSTASATRRALRRGRPTASSAWRAATLEIDLPGASKESRGQRPGRRPLRARARRTRRIACPGSWSAARLARAPRRRLRSPSSP
jgi:hypothetical protein